MNLLQPARHMKLLAVAGIGLVSLAGCGGGGGGVAGNGSSTRAVYVADAFGDRFSQVWVTLYRIEASADSSTFQTVFDDSIGKTINLSTLVNSAEFLGSITAPSSGFTKLRVVVGDHMTLVPKAGGAGQSVPLDNSIPTANGKSTISFDVTAPAAHHDVVVDFDLAAFELLSGKVRPHVKHGDDNAVRNSEKHADLEGVVANLTSNGFDLVRGATTIKVQIGANTTVFSEKLGSAAILANGQRVEVKGRVDPDSHVVLANAVKVEDGDHHGGSGGDDHHHEGAGLEGAVTTVNAADKSFVVMLHEAEHFIPSGSAVTVKTDNTTVFEKRHAGHAGFADITTGARVEVSGTYDDTTNTLSAKRVEIR